MVHTRATDAEVSQGLRRRLPQGRYRVRTRGERRFRDARRGRAAAHDRRDRHGEPLASRWADDHGRQHGLRQGRRRPRQHLPERPQLAASAALHSRAVCALPTVRADCLAPSSSLWWVRPDRLVNAGCSVIERIRLALVKEFELEFLYFTAPTFITRLVGNASWSPTEIHDEYWCVWASERRRRRL